MIFIETDYGGVRLSPKVLRWAESYDTEIWNKVKNKRLRSGHVKNLRRQVARLESAVMLAAEIEFATGGVLREF